MKRTIFCALATLCAFNANAESYVPTPKTPLTLIASNPSDYGVHQIPTRSDALPWQLCVHDECAKVTPKTLVTQMPIKEMPQKQSALHKVYFDFGKSSMAVNEVNRLASLKDLSLHKELLLRGWTDPVGGINSMKNVELANLRANAVKDYIRDQLNYQGIIRIQYIPACCNRPGTKQSPEQLRREMRVVEVLGVN